MLVYIMISANHIFLLTNNYDKRRFKIDKQDNDVEDLQLQFHDGCRHLKQKECTGWFRYRNHLALEQKFREFNFLQGIISLTIYSAKTKGLESENNITKSNKVNRILVVQ